MPEVLKADGCKASRHGFCGGKESRERFDFEVIKKLENNKQSRYSREQALSGARKVGC